MITEDYISFESAKLLKEKGFNEKVSRWYVVNYPSEGVVTKGFGTDNDYIPAPTLQMAMKWLREVHKIHVAIYPYGDYSCDNYQFDTYKDGNFVVSKDDGYITYEEACEAAIKYCLEILI